jgi:hypothetical protein
MQRITINILEGLDRGRVYENIYPPIKIGREDDNTIQLNDDRVSRYHAKIQESDGHLILTDLQSTNGTRVNGFPVNIRVLQPGDLLWIGRCLLHFNPPEFSLDNLDATKAKIAPHDDVEQTIGSGFKKFEAEELSGFEGGEHLFPRGMPQLPENLSGAQLALFSDFVAYVHHMIIQQANLAMEAQVKLPLNQGSCPGMMVPHQTWQQLMKLEKELAQTLRNITEP